MANITSLVAGKVAKIGLRLADLKKKFLATLVPGVPESFLQEVYTTGVGSTKGIFATL